MCAAGDYDRGLSLLRKAHSTDPEDADICCSLGNALAEHGEYEEALQCFRSALDIEPNHPAATALMETVESEVRERNRPAHIPYKPPLMPPGPAARQKLHIIDPYPEPPPRRSPSLYKIPWLTFFVSLFLAANCGYALWLGIHPVDYFSSDGAGQKYDYIVEKTVADNPENRLAMIDNPGNVPDKAIIPPAPGPTFHIFKTNCINKQGVKAGVIKVNGLVRAFTLDKTTAVFLNPLPGDDVSCAESINDSGQVVGYTGAGKRRAIIWKNGRPVDLNDEIPGGSCLTLTDAICIDDSGTIVVSALNLRGESKIASLTPM